MEANKNGPGKLRLTVELEVNQAAMELIKENTDTMVNAVSQSVSALRSGSKNGFRHKQTDASVAGIVHPGQEITP
ncbi:MAG: hypothetical protein LBH74_02670 [Nitrososphaerota archaeon]|jgi:hypothetical protein|uniref:hypothetical protein n=1 Tax=Candidatus Bathycorpusculum sp. TaxID=2994959 RepID=UPI00281C5DF8|nr:hypothetical protein [Candidatus Termitimicrobium sp.]MCL2431559.1 hypothetical protein [Candidatus Termitimicrobium sp.]MDR0492529.1 hypothetical protein [Nitrososphaerota archaeon]